MKESATFGGVLRQYRLAAGLTQEALARQAGLSLRCLPDLERQARSYPHPVTVEQLAAALGLSDDGDIRPEIWPEQAMQQGPVRLTLLVGIVTRSVRQIPCQP